MYISGYACINALSLLHFHMWFGATVELKCTVWISFSYGSSDTLQNVITALKLFYEMEEDFLT